MENEIIPAIESLFGKARDPVDLGVSGAGAGNFYTPAYDRISLDSAGAFDSRTMAHEFGHAWMEKAAGGNPNSSQCVGSHSWNIDSGYRCALSEGFADFVALLAGFDSVGDHNPDTAYLDVGYTDASKTTAVDSAFLGIEGAIAFFFQDVFDSSNSESYDNVYISPTYVDEIFSSCEVPTHLRATRIHWMIHCIEKGISGYTLGFPPIDYPSSYSVSSGHTVNAQDLRALWRWHLFNSGDTVPPSPPTPPAISLFGPDSVRPSTSCYWFTSASGTGTLAYAWYKNSALQGSTSSDAIIPTGTTPFDVIVKVFDAWGQFDADTISVAVSGGADICPV